jgi:hypothetical protein
VPLVVYRNGIVTTDLEVISIEESAGADRLDTAQLLYKNLNLENREFHSQIVCEEIEIVRGDTGEVLHWGKIGIVPPELHPRSESLIVVSRTEKFHVGDRLRLYPVWKPGVGVVDVSHDLVFNPIIDEKVQGNLNDTKTNAGTPLFLDPESVRTAAARTLQGANTTTWPLSKCIYFLLTWLNGLETYVDNPSLSVIEAATNDADDLVLNLTIPRGTWLADALDMLLVPLGYRWRVKRTALGQRTFEFFNRTAGTLVWLHHQAIGSTLTVGETNVEAAGMRFDVTNLANEVTVVGGYYAYEMTFELARAWPEADDGKERDELKKDHPDFDDVRDVFRKWVLNEAGDYIGLRPELDNVYTSAFRTAIGAAGLDVADQFVPRRRKLMPTLTLASDNTPIGDVEGVDIEYSNTSPEEWKTIQKVGNATCKLLDHEAGVYFDASSLPEEFFEDPANLKIRVTATIQTDKRLESTAARQADSPQADVAPLVLDVPTKFRHQQVTTQSKYSGSGKPSLEQVDLTAIGAFAVRVRQIWDLMDVGGVVQLDGLDATDVGTVYQIGQRVRGILGKNLFFRAKNGADEFPQIVAIDRDINKQSMTLHLQRISEPLAGAKPKRGRT